MSAGKRGGSRKAAKPKRQLSPAALLLTAGVTGCVIAWGYLVYAAIDFGTTARGGDARAWGMLALASLGAIACLFTGLLLVARLLRVLGILAPAEARATSESDGSGTAPPVPAPRRTPGGRRAAR